MRKERMLFVFCMILAEKEHRDKLLNIESGSVKGIFIYLSFIMLLKNTTTNNLSITALFTCSLLYLCGYIVAT